MREFYFIEVNLICIIFLFFIRGRTRKNEYIGLGEKIFNFSIICSELMCLTDALAGIFNGSEVEYVRLILEISNLGYFVAASLATTCWTLYVYIKFKIELTPKRLALLSLPFVLALFIIVTNPFTHLLYSIDDMNKYSRGPLMFVYWIVIFIYLMIATITSIVMTKKEYNTAVRKANISFCLFGVFPTIGFLSQIMFYGITTITVGVAFGYLFYYIRNLESQISEDVLTGLNNRKQMEHYISELLHRGCENPIFVIMMDINDFKQINDIHGHAAGDDALIDLADAIKNSSKDWYGDYIACRYGGDEFSLVGELQPGVNLENFIKIIRDNIEEVVQTNGRNYTLSVSIGYSYAICNKASEYENILNEADERMYAEKKRIKAERSNSAS